MVEPVQGEGGYVVPPQKFFDELARVAKQNGILLIFDEVQSGMGRTGKMWAAEHFDAVPDILAVAKGIASGMPLGATVARADLMTWPPGAHASTFGGNPVACAAALATIALLEEELVENAARMGAHLMDRMRDWPARFPVVGEVRGLGLMIGIELVRDQATKEKAPRLRDRVVELAFERGLLVLGAGDITLRLCPPLVITRDQCDFAMETLEECLKDSHSGRMRILDVGCGIHKQPGAIGIDRNPASRADVLADLDRFPYPFADSSFDRLTAIHVIEHVNDVIRTMEEFHRLVRAGGTVRIETPHYTDFSSFCDPTHKSHLNSFSFRYFGENHGGFGYYSPVRFREISVRLQATGFLEVAGIRISGEPLSALPAVLGVLPLLRGARQGDGVRIRSAEMMLACSTARPTPSGAARCADRPWAPGRRPGAPLSALRGAAPSWRAITGRAPEPAKSIWWRGTARRWSSWK